MSLYLKIILILFGLAYLISPVDIIPDLLLPFVGWIDDGVVLWSILHLIRHGELPWFFFKKKHIKGTQKSSINQAKRSYNNRSNPGQASSKSNGETENNQFDRGNGSPSFKSAHDILGVSANATLKEIQTAYKEKIKQYHPDKVSHLGEEFSDLANEKFLEIQRAYETMKTKL